jgi:hypothetical protein
MVLPVLLRTNICIVNIDTKSQDMLEGLKYNLFHGKSDLQNFMIFCNNSDALNLHSKTLYVMLKESHYISLFVEPKDDNS